MQRQRGFTLLEVLLVLTLMALVATSMVLTFSSTNPSEQLERQALRFKIAMTMAADRALLTGQELGLMVTDEGYQFLEWKEAEWRPIAGDKALMPFTFEEPLDMRLVLTLDGLPWQEETLFESDGLFENLFADEEDKKKLIPQVFIYSFGEFTDFDLVFEWRGSGERTEIHVAGLTDHLEIMTEDEAKNASERY